MERIHPSEELDALVRQISTACELAGRDDIALAVSQLADAVRDLACDRERLLRERDQLLEERTRMASRLTRGPQRRLLAEPTLR